MRAVQAHSNARSACPAAKPSGYSGKTRRLSFPASQMTLSNNANIFANIKLRYTSAIITRIAFGYHLTSGEDVYLDIARNATDVVEATGSPGGSLVDFFPFRKYGTQTILLVSIKFYIVQHFPSWFPGTHCVNVARRGRPAVRRLHDFPLSQVQEQLVCFPHCSRIVQ